MTAIGRSPAEPQREVSPGANDLAVDPATIQGKPQPLRLVEGWALTRRAHRILRRHFVRAAVRVAILLVGDAAALLLLRAFLRGIRDSAWLGAATSTLATRIIPPGAVSL